MCDSGGVSLPSVSDVVKTATLGTVNVDNGGNVSVQSLNQIGDRVASGVNDLYHTAVSVASLGTAQINQDGSLGDGLVTRGVGAAGNWIENAAHDTGHFIERGVREGSESLTGVAARRQMTEQANAALSQAEQDRQKQMNDSNYRSMMNDRQASNIAASGRSSTAGARQTLGSGGGLSTNTFLGL